MDEYQVASTSSRIRATLTRKTELRFSRFTRIIAQTVCQSSNNFLKVSIHTLRQLSSLVYNAGRPPVLGAKCVEREIARLEKLWKAVYEEGTA